MKAFVKFIVNPIQRIFSTEFYLQKSNIKILDSYFVLDNQDNLLEKPLHFWPSNVSPNALDTDLQIGH